MGGPAESPALFTRMSIPPKLSSAVSMMRPALSNAATESWLAAALPQAARVSAATSSAGGASLPEPSIAVPMSLTTTAAPSRASSIAVARPMPRPAPVTTATLPASVTLKAHLPSAAPADVRTIRAAIGTPVRRPQPHAQRKASSVVSSATLPSNHPVMPSAPRAQLLQRRRGQLREQGRRGVAGLGQVERDVDVLAQQRCRLLEPADVDAGPAPVAR